MLGHLVQSSVSKTAFLVAEEKVKLAQAVNTSYVPSSQHFLKLHRENQDVTSETVVSSSNTILVSS